MAENIQDTVNSLKLRLNSLKNSEKLIGDSLKNKITSGIHIPSKDNLGKKLSAFGSKLSKKNENKQDVFKHLIEVVEIFLKQHKPSTTNPNSPNNHKSRLVELSKQALKKTVRDSRQIVMDSVSEVLFVGDGVCGTNQTFSLDTLEISPKDFDFLNILMTEPSSGTGQIYYESNKNSGYSKMNTNLFNCFSQNGSKSFYTRNDTKLFDYSFDTNTQKYYVTNLSGISGTTLLRDFMTGYYSSIEHVDFDAVLKTAMMMTLNGDGSEPVGLNIAMNDLNRILSKLCAFCGNSQTAVKNMNQTTSTQFNENDEDVESYFDFNDVEGIDLDSESDRLNKVLRFADCNNFTVPVNTTHMEDFIFLPKNIDKAINDTLYNAAVDAHNQSDSSIPLQNFHINLFNSFILNLPKALIASVLSPKYFFPILIVYKAITNGTDIVINGAKDLMRKLHKLFNSIIKKLLWKFRDYFWQLVKPDLIAFLLEIGKKILTNKIKRYLAIIKGLIALLSKIISIGVASCKGLFGLINTSIDGLLSLGQIAGTQVPPGFLLSMSYLLGGESADILKIQILQDLQQRGVNTGAIYGKQVTNLQHLVSSTAEQSISHRDQFGFVSVGNEGFQIPTPFGKLTMPGGILVSHGKNF